MKTNKVKKSTIIVTVLASAFTAVACVLPYNPPCGDGGKGKAPEECDDGHTVDFCASSDSMTLDQYASTGKSQVTSSGHCTWECFYKDDYGHDMGCSNKQAPWAGYKPGSSSCPNGSPGSGS